MGVTIFNLQTVQLLQNINILLEHVGFEVKNLECLHGPFLTVHSVYLIIDWNIKLHRLITIELWLLEI